MRRSIILTSLCVAMTLGSLFGGLASAQTKEYYSLAVSEGTSGGITPQEIVDKYTPVARQLAATLKRNVVVVPVRSFAELEAGQKQDLYEFVMARPSDYPARGLRDYGYKIVATARSDGHCLLVVHKDSPIKTIAEAKGRHFIMPEKAAYMTRFCTAELRDAGIVLDSERVKYAKEQNAIAWAVQNRLADVAGIASYSGTARNLDKNDLRIIRKSRSQPFLPLIASKRITDEQVAAVRAGLDTWQKSADGKEVVAKLGNGGFQFESPERLLALLTWLGH